MNTKISESWADPDFKFCHIQEEGKYKDSQQNLESDWKEPVTQKIQRVVIGSY